MKLFKIMYMVHASITAAFTQNAKSNTGSCSECIFKKMYYEIFGDGMLYSEECWTLLIFRARAVQFEIGGWKASTSCQLGQFSFFFPNTFLAASQIKGFSCFVDQFSTEPRILHLCPCFFLCEYFLSLRHFHRFGYFSFFFSFLFHMRRQFMSRKI